MPVTIKGIRVDTIAIKRSDETGGYDIENSSYSLVSSTDHILAKQSIGSYGGLTLKPSPATMKALEEFTKSYKADVVAILGLE